MIRIQELEREREQIMDVFEEQLNVVLEVVPDSSYTRSPTPCDPILDSPTAPKSPSRARTAPRSRPTTRDSEMSSLSRLTQGTQMSMMGAIRQGAEKYRGGGSSFMSSDLEGRAYERSDYVSQRIAAIQAKVSRPQDDLG
jgi:nicotinamide N-methyltransferase